MKALFFDTGPVITLILSRLVEILPQLKEKFGGKFYITPAVRKELIERPITVRRFEFEALQVLQLVNKGVLEVYEKVPIKKVDSYIALANAAFEVNGKPMDIIQSGEMESIAAAVEVGTAVVMDERTLRLLLEDAAGLKELLERRFESPITINLEKVRQLQQMVQVSIIRSVELLGVSYKLGLLQDYLPPQRGGKELLLDAVLWNAKYNGCAVTEEELGELKQFLLK